MVLREVKVSTEGHEYWKPTKIGEKLCGVIISAEEGMYGTTWTIKTRANMEIKTSSHKILQSKLGACKIGDYVEIIFEGEIPTKIKGRNPTSDYTVLREEEDTQQGDHDPIANSMGN